MALIIAIIECMILLVLLVQYIENISFSYSAHFSGVLLQISDSERFVHTSGVRRIFLKGGVLTINNWMQAAMPRQL